MIDQRRKEDNEGQHSDITLYKEKKKAECINSSWETRTKNQLQRGRGYSRLTIVVSMIHSDVRF